MKIQNRLFEFSEEQAIASEEFTIVGNFSSQINQNHVVGNTPHEGKETFENDNSNNNNNESANIEAKKLLETENVTNEKSLVNTFNPGELENSPLTTTRLVNKEDLKTIKNSKFENAYIPPLGKKSQVKANQKEITLETDTNEIPQSETH